MATIKSSSGSSSATSGDNSGLDLCAICTRCREVIPSLTAVCRVPHPGHLQEGCGSSFGPAAEHSFGCRACGEAYTKSSSNFECPLSKMPITEGPKWCYEGHHTAKPLSEDDDRRVWKDVVVLTSGRDLQEQVAALDGNEQVRVLKIRSEGFFDSETKLWIDIRMPNVEELMVEDVGMVKLVLTKRLTPKIRKIWMQNPALEGEPPDFTIDCPELRDFSCYFFGAGDRKWIDKMLAKATKLETFDSYKLMVRHLKFASNHLKSIRVHRAEVLRRIDLWAPRLTILDVQAAYDLQERSTSEFSDN